MGVFSYGTYPAFNHLNPTTQRHFNVNFVGKKRNKKGYQDLKFSRKPIDQSESSKKENLKEKNETLYTSPGICSGQLRHICYPYRQLCCHRVARSRQFARIS